VPVEARRLIPADELAMPAVAAVATPGHAVHQYSYLIDDLLFAGEAGGVCIGLGEGRFYMRPATPPRFFLETNLESIDRLIALKPGRICYGHIGLQRQAGARLADHSRQLLLWQRLIKPWVDADGQLTPAREDDCLDHLLANDPLLAGFTELSTEAQERERFFLRNSLRGYWGYLSGR